MGRSWKERMELNHRKREALGSKVRKLDIFGSKINLTFKGNHAYKTNFGACMTMIVIIAIILYALLGISKLLTNEIVGVHESKMFVNVDQSDAFDPTKVGFRLGFGFYGTDFDPKFGTFELQQENMVDGVSQSPVPLVTSKCGD